MNDSMSSTNYMRKISSCRDDNSSEESSWTSYFEDFMANGDNSLCASGYQSSSMLSDAACAETINLGDNNGERVRTAGTSLLQRNRKNLICQRRKTKALHVDEELEDTASSPGNSPKINDLYRLYMKSEELNSGDVSQAYNSNHFQTEQKQDHFNNFPQEVKGHDSQQAVEGIDMSILETELRKKGLCLVPTSMLLSYLD